VRFSTVAGSRGSADTVRDVHGFATRFYTDEGNYGKLKLFVDLLRRLFPGQLEDDVPGQYVGP
jgi:hypothetical protein